MECNEQEFGEKCRKSPAEDENEDDVQQFFAVIDRIHSMHKLRKQKSINFSSAGKLSTSWNAGGSVIKSKPPWKPSFQLEDFALLAGKDTTFTGSDRSNNAISTSVVCEKPCIRSDQNMGVMNFDLNVEATAEE